jgi:predicted transcriptional regulator
MNKNILNEEYQYATLEEKIEMNRQERIRYQDMMRPGWICKGQELRKIREGLKISQREVANCVGSSVSVIARLEKGDPIQRRPVIERSYETALKYIPLHRKEIAGII